MGGTGADGGGGGVPTWVIGVVINIIGATAINLGTNLMKLSHNDKQRRAQGQQLEDAEVERSDAIHGRMNGTGSPPRQRHHVKARDTSDSDSEDRPRELPPLKTRLSDMWQRAIRRMMAHHSRGGFTAAGTQRSMATIWEVFRWLRQKVWGVGMALFVGGNIANFISFAYAPQSMLAALGSVQFVSNVFCARFILGEEVTPRIVLGTVVIIVGQTLIVTFSTHQSADYDARGLMKLYDAEFLTYLGVLAIVGGSLSLVYQRYRVAEKRGAPLPYSEGVLPVSYAMPSAMLGTLSLLEAKSLSELLSATMRGDNQLKFFFTWVVLVLWVLLMVFWLNRMNTALRLFDGLMIIPLLQVFWTFFGLMVGGIFFKEFQTYTPKMLGLFCLGVATVFAGVYMLSPRHTDDEDFEELEEAPSEIADSSITTTDSLRALMAMQHQQLEESGSTAAVMRSSSGLSSVGRVSREHSGADMSVSDIGSASTRRRSLERRRSLDILEQREDTRLLGFGGMPFVASDNRFANFVDHLTPRVEELPDRSPASTRSGASLPRSGSLRPSHSGCGSFDAAVSATRDRPVYQHSRSQTWNVGPWNTQAAGGGERPPGDAPVGVTGPHTGVLRPLETHTHDVTPHTPTLSSLPLPPLTGVTPDHGPTAAQPRYSSSSDLTMSTLALSPPAPTHAQTHTRTHTRTRDEGSEREGEGSQKDERMTRSLLRTDV